VNDLTAKEIGRLIHLVSQKIDTDDFAYQDEDYQKEWRGIEEKLIQLTVALQARD
jgi:hypothetical protein